jgi:hypothetical protein
LCCGQMRPMAPLHEVCHALPFDGIPPSVGRVRAVKSPNFTAAFLRLIAAENGKGVGVRKRRE